MRKLTTVLLALFGFASAAAAPPASPEAEMARELRAMAFGLSPADIGITRENHPQPVWGVLMETTYEEGYFTLVVLADGSTSLYYSHGNSARTATGCRSFSTPRTR